MLHRRFDPLGLTSNILTNDVFAYKAVGSTIDLALKGHINNAGTQFSSLLSHCFSQFLVYHNLQKFTEAKTKLQKLSLTKHRNLLL